MRKYAVTRNRQEYVVTVKYVVKATGETGVHTYTTNTKTTARKEAAKFTANNPDYGVYDAEVKTGDKVIYGIKEDDFMRVAEYICTKPATPNNAEAEQED